MSEQSGKIVELVKSKTEPNLLRCIDAMKASMQERDCVAFVGIAIMRDGAAFITKEGCYGRLMMMGALFDLLHVVTKEADD